MNCKHCGEYVGEFLSEVSEHLWTKHREIISQFLKEQQS